MSGIAYCQESNGDIFQGGLRTGVSMPRKSGMTDEQSKGYHGPITEIVSCFKKFLEGYDKYID